MLSLLQLCLLISVASTTTTSNPTFNKKIVIFQFLDESFLELWLNWWAIILQFNILSNEIYSLHLACQGDSILNERVKVFHPRGCDQIEPIHSETRGRIYYSKWLAFVTAFRKHRSDMLLIDIDAQVIRDPLSVLRDSDDVLRDDIIASRDHGHDSNDFPYSEKWSTARLCTGFIYFRYSSHTEKLVTLVLERQKKYGQGDQISLNNIFAQSGVNWQSNVSFLKNDNFAHRGQLLWYGQANPEFVSPYALNHSFNSTQSHQIVAKLKVKLLNRHQVLRYCSINHKLLMLEIIPNAGIPETNETVALHCFVWAAGGEQGQRKAHVKATVMESLSYWILDREKVYHIYKHIRVPKSRSHTEKISYGLTVQSPKSIAILRFVTDPHLVVKMRNTWLDRESTSESMAYFRTFS